MSIFVQAPAKVHLYLDIIDKDPATGYFYTSSILVLVPTLFDEITIEPLPGYFHIDVVQDPKSKFKVPLGEDNICFKAASLLHKEAMATGNDHKLSAIKIMIKTNISPMGGFGTGSSNAAAVIRALNKLWDLNFSHQQLVDIVAEIGMEGIFFMENVQCAYVNNFTGECEEIEMSGKLSLEFFDTEVQISVDEILKHIDMEKCRGNKEASVALWQDLIEEPSSVHAHLHNDLERVIGKLYPEIAKWLEKLRNKYSAAFLCGAGNCIAVITRGAKP